MTHGIPALGRLLLAAMVLAVTACAGSNGATSSGSSGSTTSGASFAPEVIPQASVVGFVISNPPRVGIFAFPSSIGCAEAPGAFGGPFLDVEVDNESAPGTYAVAQDGPGIVHAEELPASDGLPLHRLQAGSGTITLTRAGPDEVAGSFDVQVTAIYDVACDGGCGVDSAYEVYADAGRLSGSFDEPVCAGF